MAKIKGDNAAKWAYGGGTHSTAMPAQKAKNHEAHTSPTKKGLGDYYGSGVRAKIGKMRGESLGFESLSKKKMSTPPKTLA